MKMLKKNICAIFVFLFLSVLLSSCLTTNYKKDEESADMVVVPAGWFRMGLNSAEINERPEHDVYLDTYLIDKYEVSANQFAEFLGRPLFYGHWDIHCRRQGG
jgi:formylglycine-generating enzyme required for sulfatase activity